VNRVLLPDPGVHRCPLRRTERDGALEGSCNKSRAQPGMGGRASDEDHSAMSRVSVVIVSWNAREFLRKCLVSIRSTAADCVSDVIVVDNASSDGSPEMVRKEFPEVELIEPGDNLGFARANNLAMQKPRGDYLALINSDVVVEPGCIQRLMKFMDEQPHVGLA